MSKIGQFSIGAMLLCGLLAALQMLIASHSGPHIPAWHPQVHHTSPVNQLNQYLKQIHKQPVGQGDRAEY